jgi:hypothetical protein
MSEVLAASIIRVLMMVAGLVGATSHKTAIFILATVRILVLT